MHTGYKVQAMVTGLRGECNAGHKVGDRFELSSFGEVHQRFFPTNIGNLCGYFYASVHPFALVLMCGGELPWQENRDSIEVECPDRRNALKLELQRIR